MRFRNKTILVTGGGRGIGLACARRFRDEGATVVVAQRSGSEHFPSVRVDLARPEDCADVIEQTLELGDGRLDVLVNNAGMMREGSVEAASLQDWTRTLAVNLLSPAMLIKHAMPQLRASRGSIVNVGSIEGLGSNPGHGVYAASKGGLHALTRAVAVDHGADGVRCNAVAPGWIDTELNEDFVNAMPDPAGFRRRIGEVHPLRRAGSPEEVAALVCWLAAADAAFVTGQVYTVDGGRMAMLSLPR